MRYEKYDNVLDKDIVDLIVNGKDKESFAVLYARYKLLVYRKCFTITNSKALSDELTQEIFCKVYDKLPSFRNEANFSTWLFTIVYNHCIDFLREASKIRNEGFNVDIADEELDEEALDLSELKTSRMESVLENLNPMDKSILLMKYQEGFKLKRIQEVLQLSESATKMKIKRAKAKALKLYQKMF